MQWCCIAFLLLEDQHIAWCFFSVYFNLMYDLLLYDGWRDGFEGRYFYFWAIVGSLKNCSFVREAKEDCTFRKKRRWLKRVYMLYIQNVPKLPWGTQSSWRKKENRGNKRNMKEPVKKRKVGKVLFSIAWAQILSQCRGKLQSSILFSRMR